MAFEYISPCIDWNPSRKILRLNIPPTHLTFQLKLISLFYLLLFIFQCQSLFFCNTAYMSGTTEANSCKRRWVWRADLHLRRCSHLGVLAVWWWPCWLPGWANCSNFSTISANRLTTQCACAHTQNKLTHTHRMQALKQFDWCHFSLFMYFTIHVLYIAQASIHCRQSFLNILLPFLCLLLFFFFLLIFHFWQKEKQYMNLLPMYSVFLIFWKLQYFWI